MKISKEHYKLACEMIAKYYEKNELPEGKFENIGHKMPEFMTIYDYINHKTFMCHLYVEGVTEYFKVFQLLNTSCNATPEPILAAKGTRDFDSEDWKKYIIIDFELNKHILDVWSNQ